MAEVQVRLKLFGIFRKYGERPEIEFAVPAGTTIERLRPHVARVLKLDEKMTSTILRDSAFGDTSRVLRDHDAIGLAGQRVELAILPPVCGG